MRKIILCRTAWMKYYEGHANIDIPRSGAKYIQKNKTGGEIYNFKNRNGKVYGYFPYIEYPNIYNLDSYHQGGDLNNVTVVFCATHPVEGGIRVVGWYKNATVYAKPREDLYTYRTHTEARYKDAHLVKEDDRVMDVSGLFGRSSLFYFSLHPEHRENKYQKLINYISSNGKVKISKRATLQKNANKRAFQRDIEKRLLVERKAIALAFKYYKDRYDGTANVKSVEKENKGWDLEIKKNSIKLNIEVKGLSGSDIQVELTPNEYKAFSVCSEKYHLFIASNVLSRRPEIRVYKYQKKGKIWVAGDKTVLNKTLKISAMLYLK